MTRAIEFGPNVRSAASLFFVHLIQSSQMLVNSKPDSTRIVDSPKSERETHTNKQEERERDKLLF